MSPEDLKKVHKLSIQWQIGAGTEARDQLHKIMILPENKATRKEIMDKLAARTEVQLINGERHFLLFRGADDNQSSDSNQQQATSYTYNKKSAQDWANAKAENENEARHLENRKDLVCPVVFEHWIAEKYLSYSYNDVPPHEHNAESEVIVGPINLRD
jgi:RNA-binding protein YhbY